MASTDVLVFFASFMLKDNILGYISYYNNKICRCTILLTDLDKEPAFDLAVFLNSSLSGGDTRDPLSLLEQRK